ncbi:ABC transporter ATP-binding protein [Corynebacterium sp. H128]|uniref:ABC transporter ATP-binding protein n=1 Tax=Corynebacterium sp. H128 TaxID=3133427 RepID=UPI00309CB0DB
MSSATAINTLSQYRRLMSPEAWRQFRFGLILGALNGALHGASLITLVPLTTSLVTQQPSYGMSFRAWLITLGVMGLSAVAIDFLGTRTSYMAALRMLDDIYAGVGNKVASLPLGWFREGTGARLSRMVSQEMMSVAEFAAHYFYALLVQISSAAVIMIGSWFVDWRLGLMLLLSAPLMTLFLWLGRGCFRHGRKRHEPTEDEVAIRIVEFAKCQQALRSSDRGTDYAELEDALKTNERVGRTSMYWETLGQILSGSMIQSIVVAIILVTGFLLTSGSLSAVTGIGIIGIALRFHAVLASISSSIVGLEDRRSQIDSFSTVMLAEVLPTPTTSKALSSPGHVELREVSFGYTPEQLVLRGVSLDVAPHSMCAIVGPSGCGKTTLLRLLARFYDTTAGNVSIGGVDVRDQSTEDLMSQLSMVFQDVYLFDDTLEANIRVGRPDASDADVYEAARLAGVNEIIDRLPQGWASTVGEGGRALSGGERQRVSIARALLKQAPIVLFDEATSALDAENEANIIAAMDKLRENSTLIVIAHKLETIRKADMIVVLDHTGRVVQRGTHEELITQPGQYQRFWNARSQASGWSLTPTTN